MKKIFWLIIIIAIGLIVLKIFTITPLGWKAKLNSPMGQKNQNIVTPSPIPALNMPKTFKFDGKTDLKQELNKVNPQVLDSDFE